ncbi:MAG: tRNA (N6-threonylcarbamoyladenosine(37)-N6)-methyltransferase TrmO [Clostridia bacterium]|nr:tRNA (N6-threonylcarbamoyladenosine(37)-N6)-methyltransferase TrmO [Clostridia bacterium]
MEVKTIAHIYNDFPTKFGLPRQSGLAQALTGRIVFEPEYRNADAVRGLEDYSHIWLIWQFSEAVRDTWSPTVRPPRLGGNKRMGVFATRSPFRPNPFGLSCVKLERVEQTQQGPVLHVLGADLMNGTPIYDIKPYLPFADSVPGAVGGFADGVKDYGLDVVIRKEAVDNFDAQKLEALKDILSQDPRPSYQNDPDRVYGFEFAGKEIRFKVADGVLTVIEII